MRWVLVLAVATACYRDPRNCEVGCLDEGRCPSDMTCGSDLMCHLSDHPACNETSDGSVPNTCFEPHLSGFAPPGTMVCVTATLKEFPAEYDTTTCTGGKLYEQAAGGVACIVALTDGATIATRVYGDYPLVIVAPSFHVAGIDASSAKSGDGPGAHVQPCRGAEGLGNDMGGGGGAGGGGQGIGGGGGNGPLIAGAASTPPHQSVGLEAGCSGANGGEGELTDPASNQGLGGGAVYLVTPALSVAGKVIANGGGGKESVGSHGGGGGGAGGMIVLEAKVIDIQGYLIANGGGGSGGNNGNSTVTSAPETPPTGAPSLGGNGSDPNAAGGASSGLTAVYSLDGQDGGDASSTCGGGGGGGGAGFIIVIHPIGTTFMPMDTMAYPPVIEHVY